jgi:hypothetical protein
MTTPGDVRSFAHTGTNSGPSLRGTGSSNPFRSANESLVCRFLTMFAKSARLRRLMARSDDRGSPFARMRRV